MCADADNNRLLVDSPHDAPDSAPNSARSGGDQDSGNGEVSIFDLAQNKNNNGQHDNRDSSGYGRWVHPHHTQHYDHTSPTPHTAL